MLDMNFSADGWLVGNNKIVTLDYDRYGRPNFKI